jgi:uncharacterized protein (TIGR00290 family)
MTENIIVSWSGGKDSCMALYEVLKTGQYKVEALLTTIWSDNDQVSMHGVPLALILQQAESLRLPLHIVYIPQGASNQLYEATMKDALSQYRPRGVETVIFGDLFLEDIRNYRDHLLARTGMRAVYPVWKRNTSEFIKEFLDSGFKAVVTSVDSTKLERSFAGRIIDDEFLASLPDDVDPCGENGEFHTFVFAGPIFKEEIRFKTGETVLKNGLYFCEIIPG